MCVHGSEFEWYLLERKYCGLWLLVSTVENRTEKKIAKLSWQKRSHFSVFFSILCFFLSSPRFLRNRCSNDWMRIDEKEKHPFRIIIDQSAVIARQRLCIFLFCNYQMYINNTHKNFFFDVVFYMKKHRDIQISKKKRKTKRILSSRYDMTGEKIWSYTLPWLSPSFHDVLILH